MKYILEKSKVTPGWWCLTDPLGVARALRGMAEYMAENHPHTAY